jgi:hypothetical protein
MKQVITFTEDSIEAVKHHTERTALHNEEFTCMTNEGKLGHRDYGTSDWEGKVLIECPVTGIKTLHWVITQETEYRSGRKYLQVSTRPYHIDSDPKKYNKEGGQ